MDWCTLSVQVFIVFVLVQIVDSARKRNRFNWQLGELFTESFDEFNYSILVLIQNQTNSLTNLVAASLWCRRLDCLQTSNFDLWFTVFNTLVIPNIQNVTLLRCPDT